MSETQAKRSTPAHPADYPARVSCQCRAQWFVDWRDDRGERSVTPHTAAVAMEAGFQAWLGKVCDPWSERSCPSFMENVCSVCGWPNPIDGVTKCERGWPGKRGSWKGALSVRMRSIEIARSACAC